MLPLWVNFWDQYSLLLQYEILRNWWHSFFYMNHINCGPVLGLDSDHGHDQNKKTFSRLFKWWSETRPEESGTWMAIRRPDWNKSSIQMTFQKLSVRLMLIPRIPNVEWMESFRWIKNSETIHKCYQFRILRNLRLTSKIDWKNIPSL